MELKPGYKQTEVGMIPNDWDCKSLGEIGEALIGLTYKPSDVCEFGTLVLRSSNIQGDALAFDDNVHVDTNIPQRILVRNGDVLICVRNGSRELIGKSAYLDDRVNGMTFGAFMAVHRGPHGRLVSFLFQSDILKRQINEHLGATINQITNKSLNSFYVPLPSNEHELSTIAATLGDVDALLSALDALIAKQRDLKTAAMQQLLTGKTRLPGFGGEWEVKRLGEVLAVRHGKNQKEVEADDGEFPILATGGQIGWAKQWLYNKTSVLIGRKGTIDRPQYMDTPFWTVDTLFFTELKGENVAKFFFYRFGLIDWMQYNEASGVPSLNARTIENIEISFPHPEEQTAIAEVLSDMDAQLVALKQRREKTALLKQGMMQELLTGRTRLVQPAAKSASNVVPFAKQEAKGNERKANVHFQRSVFAAEIVNRLYAEPTFGHVKFQKLIYLAEHMCKVDIGANYHRDAAGPYDNRALRSIDSQLKKSKWFEAKKVDGRYQYIPLEEHGDHKPYFDRYFSNMRDTFDKVIDTFKLLDTERCEIVATLYEAWHDLLLKNSTATDDAIVDQVLNHWHDAKKRIPKDRWHKALGWMRENGFVPG